MSRILIFAGTTEGRKLAERLAEAQIACTVCVATEYGAQVMEAGDGVEVLQGRRTEQEMEELLQRQDFLAVVDATHPFATEVSGNIRESTEKQGVPYLRLKRAAPGEPLSDAMPEVVYYPDSEACAAGLKHTKGNILLTTGSKELHCYCEKESIRERLYVRVLPGIESLGKCQAEGLPGKQILALQGPFSEELNRALLREYQIEHLVTKESGAAGGYPQKVSAAGKEGVTLHVIGNPERTEGLSFAQVCEQLGNITGKPLRQRRKLRIGLLGAGMGTRDGMTGEALRFLDSAGYVFGAERLLAAARPGQTVFPYYLARDILPVLERLLADELSWEEQTVCVLFSGDCGFFSGCEALYRELRCFQQEKEAEGGGDTKIELRLFPGISTVSYLSAAYGLSWQDAKLLSIHGKGSVPEWGAEVMEAVRYHEKTVLLLSGGKDIGAIGRLLCRNGRTDCRVLAGYRLGCPEEELFSLSPEECGGLEKEGLYACIIVNHRAEKRPLSHGKKDICFLRDKVPMTKEEVRETAICKLQLCEDAIVYDIGSGTGSVAVEIAERSGTLRVFAIEHKEEAVRLIRENCRKFGVENVEVIHAKAPDGLAGLPAATHAFIGGSGGQLADILTALYRINPAMQVVITAVSLETISELARLSETVPVAGQEIVQLQVSRAKPAGRYSLMQAENPVYVCSFRFTKDAVLRTNAKIG